MRRSFHLVALLAAALLAVPPAVANASCSSARCGGEPAALSCCAGTPGNMSDMESAACSTPRHAALETSVCPIRAICVAPAPSALLSGVTEGKQIIAASSAIAMPHPAPAHMRSDFAPLRAEAHSAPLKYLMFGVFRI